MSLAETIKQQMQNYKALRLQIVEFLKGLPIDQWLSDEDGKIVVPKILQFSNKLHLVYVTENNLVLAIQPLTNGTVDCFYDDGPILGDVDVDTAYELAARLPHAVELFQQTVEKQNQLKQDLIGKLQNEKSTT